MLTAITEAFYMLTASSEACLPRLQKLSTRTIQAALTFAAMEPLPGFITSNVFSLIDNHSPFTKLLVCHKSLLLSNSAEKL